MDQIDFGTAVFGACIIVASECDTDVNIEPLKTNEDIKEGGK